MSSTSGIGPRSSRTKAGPAADAGKSLTKVAPAAHAVAASVGVKTPGTNGIPAPVAAATSAGSSSGATAKSAPAARAAAS
jgi:hypothetical protein